MSTRRPGRGWHAVALRAALVVRAVFAPLAAQRGLTYTITTAPAFPAPTVANYGTGATPGILANNAGMSLNLTGNVVPEVRTFTLAVRSTAAAVTGPWAKPASDVSACWSAACTYIPLSTVFQTIGTTLVPSNTGSVTPISGTNILFRVALRWESDRPGAYTLGIQSRLTVSSP